MGRIQQNKQVYQKTTIGYQCDVCNLIVDSDTLPNDWFYFRHGHHGWGNDSHESFEDFYVCSPDCFVSQLKESYESLKDERTGEIAEMNQQFVKKLIDYIDGRSKDQACNIQNEEI